MTDIQELFDTLNYKIAIDFFEIIELIANANPLLLED